MNGIRSNLTAGILLCAAALASAVVYVSGSGFDEIERHQATESDWTDAFPVEEFSSVGANPYFILKPGYFLILEGMDGGEKIRLTITVLDETRIVDGVETRVVEEREKSVADDSLIEVSRNYFAIGRRTNSVYYFGEDVDVYRNGRVVSHAGSWQAGIRGARFGVMMPGIVLLGSRYYQEIAPGVAMDRAEHISLKERVETPAGSFSNCLKVRESTPLEPTARDFKVYADGIGLLQDNDLRLIKYGNRQ
jgi:hypothetical protein